MEDLIERIATNDTELTALTLKYECEDDDQLVRFVHACEKNHTIQSVEYRESFFPLHCIRQHLSKRQFETMLRAAGRVAKKQVKIPSSMVGMVRGSLAVHTIFENPTMEEWSANGAVTFCTDPDVQSLAEQLFLHCQNLKRIDLQNSFIKQFQRKDFFMDPLIFAASNLPDVQVLVLSCHESYVQHIVTPLISSSAIQNLLTKTNHSLTTLNLSGLGLEDEHFERIADVLLDSSSSFPCLKRLTLDDNNNSFKGTIALLRSLFTSKANSIASASPSLVYLSIKEDLDEDDGDDIEEESSMCRLSLRSLSQELSFWNWEEVFQRNKTLQYLELGSSSSSSSPLYPCMSDVEFWLQLNRMGRQKWFQFSDGIPLTLWAVLLEQMSDHSHSAVFHLLRSFPEDIIAVTNTNY